MKLEDKEIKYWKSVNETPPFINELNMNWDEIVNDYEYRMEILNSEFIKNEVKKYNSIINSITEEDIECLINDNIFPKDLLTFLNIDANTFEFISKQHNVKIGTIYDIIDKDFSKIDDVDEIRLNEM